MSSPSHLLALQVIGSLPPPPTPPHPTPLPGLGFYFVFLYLWLYLVFEDASGEDGQVKTQFSLGVRFAKLLSQSALSHMGLDLRLLGENEGQGVGNSNEVVQIFPR